MSMIFFNHDTTIIALLPLLHWVPGSPELCIVSGNSNSTEPLIQ